MGGSGSWAHKGWGGGEEGCGSGKRSREGEGVESVDKDSIFLFVYPFLLGLKFFHGAHNKTRFKM